MRMRARAKARFAMAMTMRLFYGARQHNTLAER